MASAVRKYKTRMVGKKVSPKAIAAFFVPVGLAVAGAVASWISTGNFSDTEIRTALSGAVLGVSAFLAAFVAEPGETEKVPV